MSGLLLSVAAPTPPDDAHLLAGQPLAAALRELRDVLATVRDDQYTQAQIGPIDGTLGSHVRHCLDHVEALLAGEQSGFVNYEARERGTPIERERKTALAALSAAAERLAAWRAAPQARVRVCVLFDAGERPVEVESTLAREFAFVFSHTIHHNAIIAAMLRTLGVQPPKQFGYAPSTVAARGRAACVR